MLRRFTLTIALAAAALTLAVPPAAWAQEASEEQAEITLKDVKNRLKENEKFLNEARKRGRAGDAQGMQVALDNYQRGQRGLERALERDRFRGNEWEQEDAWSRVERATRKHGEVLTDLYGRVPEQARPGIARAIENSQKGRETALERLEQARGQRIAAERRANAGPPAGVGRPGQAGPPAGIGSGRPGAGGPPAGVGGGPGAGRPPAPPKKGGGRP